jgi:hypothetical protein
MSGKTKRYDYVAKAVEASEHDYAFRSTRFANGAIRKALRKLIRDAVREANRRWITTEFGVDECAKMPTDIARKLVP